MWEILKKKFERFDFEDGFILAFLCLFAGLCVYLGLVGMADRPIRGYYLASYSTEAGVAYKVKADIDFMVDPTAFSSGDYKVAMTVLDQLQKSCRE